VLDAYSRRARLAPAALAAAPALVLAASSLSALEKQGSIIAFVMASAAVVVCGVVRSLGRKLEPDLWRDWGGAPTTQQLRWSGPATTATVQRRHRLLSALTNEELPTADQERADPDAADERYAIATTVLRELTRDSKRFPLVSVENAEYGFRRNALGLKPIAVAIAFGVWLASVALVVANSPSPRFFVPLVVGLVALIFWLALVRRSWVRSAAEFYAARLLEALEALVRDQARP